MSNQALKVSRRNSTNRRFEGAGCFDSKSAPLSA